MTHIKILYKAIVLLSLCFCLSCVSEEQFNNTPRGNFEALWKIVDEHYCFFEYKKVDWNNIYSKYAPQCNDNLTTLQSFEVFKNMLSELRDGHVNMTSARDKSRYWSWKEDYPENFKKDALDSRYLGTDYKIAAGLKYRILPENVGYIYYESFSDPIGEGNLDAVFDELCTCNGLILDIRENGGGQMTNAEKLAARFTNEETLVGYMQHKTGKGHNDFSEPQKQIIKPSKGIRWQKKVAVLTNRAVYSAANEFVKYMKCFPNAIIVGDRTGGGSGMPFSYELPNGWSIRLSACPMFDKNMQHTEFGIEPDYNVQWVDPTADIGGKDPIIEFAIRLMNEATNKTY